MVSAFGILKIEIRLRFFVNAIGLLSIPFEDTCAEVEKGT